MGIDEIIAALEQATGPDRFIDALIDCSVRFKDLRPSQPDDFDGKYGYHPGDIRVEHGFLQSQPYTSSIDAALTLVPEGCFWRLFSQGECVASVFGAGALGRGYGQRAATPALALCIAALRARQSLAVKGSE